MSNFLQQRIDSNKKSLQVLDAQISELEKLKYVNELPAPEEDGVHPYFYGAVGADGEPGVLVPFSVNEPEKSGINPRAYFEGIIRTHADAPFIWTHLGITYRFGLIDGIVDRGGNLVGLNNPNAQNNSVANPAAYNSVTTAPMPSFNIGLVDSSSGRYFFQAEEQQVNFGGSETKGEVPPGLIPDTVKNLTVSANIEGAPGHGPSSLFEIPAQTEIPMNGTVRVLVQPSNYNLFRTASLRVFVTLLGYKILVD